MKALLYGVDQIPTHTRPVADIGIGSARGSLLGETHRREEGKDKEGGRG